MKAIKPAAGVAAGVLFLLLLAARPAALAAQNPTAEQLLTRVDANEVYASLAYTGKMTIEYQGKRYVKTFTAVARTNADSFVEFTNPEDRDTRYLKKDGRLYVYSPDSEQVMLISGHLLKESMMGSDLSYEDTIENEKLSARYTAVLAGTEDMNGQRCWVLDLTARKKTESYPRQKLWVAVESGDLVRFELYALSGSRLKEYNLIRAELIGGRRFPVESEMRDLLRRNSRTLFAMADVQLDAPVPDSVFSMRNLER